MFNETIDLFFKISNPDETNFVLFFNACARIGTDETLILVKKVLSNLPNCYSENLNILTTVFDAFIKCDDLSNAEKLFSKIKRSTSSYGNLMNAYNKNAQPEKTLDLYKQMKIDDIQPDLITYLLLIKTCSNLGTFSISQSIFEQIPDSFLANSHIQNALIDMWVRILINLFFYFFI
jgi:pentatricopeptide repeat protein